jgi:hypothetical protein
VKFAEIHDAGWDHVDGDARAFVSFHGSTKADAFCKSGHQLSVASGQDAVDENFGIGDFGGLGAADVAWEVDSIATNDPADSKGFLFLGRQTEMT